MIGGRFLNGKSLCSVHRPSNNYCGVNQNEIYYIQYYNNYLLGTEFTLLAVQTNYPNVVNDIFWKSLDSDLASIKII